MKTKTKKKRTPKREECGYVIEIKESDFSYSFSVNRNKNFIDGPFWEHTDLEVKGKVTHPEKLVDKEIEVTIMGNRKDTKVVTRPEDYYGLEPKAVGIMTIRGTQSELLCWVPFDAFHMICSMFNAGEIKYFVLSGQPLYRGGADINSLHFQKQYGHEDIG